MEDSVDFHFTMESPEEKPEENKPISDTTLDASWDDDDGHRIQFITDETDVGSIPDVSSPTTFATHMDNWRPKLGHFFCSEEEFETFMKLPISNQQRGDLISKLTSHRRSAKRPIPRTA